MALIDDPGRSGNMSYLQIAIETVELGFDEAHQCLIHVALVLIVGLIFTQFVEDRCSVHVRDRVAEG